MSLIEGLLVFFVIILVYILLVIFLNKKGVLKKYDVSLWGPALLLRTKKGVSFLERIAKKKRFWKAFGNFGIIFCFIMMFLMIIVLIFQAWAILGFTPEQMEKMPGIEVALILPGINPVLPLEYIGYIILALIVAIVAHEFSHGILTFVSRLKVKSLGILYLIVPLGAFCEPDEEQLKKAEPKHRMRIYAAGPTSNFVVVLICILLFSFVFMSAVQPAADGVVLFSVDADSPAEHIGLESGMIITSINNTRITTDIGYFNAVELTKANQTINLTYIEVGKTYTKNVTLGDKYEEYKKRSSIYLTNNESYRGMGYLGVSSLLRKTAFEEQLSILKNPFIQFPDGFLIFYVIPFTGYFQYYNPIVTPFTNSYVITGPLSVIPSDVFWIIVNALYWIFWLNLAVALFNVLPMIPLDGGYLFNDVVGSIIKRVKKDITDEKREKAVKNISLFVSLSILLFVIFPWLVKYF